MSTVPGDSHQSLGIQVWGGWGVTGGREESFTVSVTGTRQAGSFKVATQERNPQRAQMRLRKQKKGVVPFLGDFLTELHRLGTAIPDDLDGNINKRRKEVQVLQEMKLLQVAAMNYRLRPLEKFVTYFKRMEQLSDKESYKLSCQLEPKSQ
ncbi:PREDICTED: ral-GDS-related protein-like isoform X2 [Colobus angolensis palliatus]|uniref:ral-GDS-related protein-like isoform X2 n=2 Tax=Colobus angolensis palliatus TaxID=336983 RepID=UPI0005F49FB4|nr:PREDICTED: ral-GDS-related protein-like isoform X2 [Colobus angolensis palliatus]